MTQLKILSLALLAGTLPAWGGEFVADCEFIERTVAEDKLADFPPRRVIAPKLAEAPLLDGKLDDAVWQKAAVLNGFQRPRAGAIVRAAARSVRGDPAEFLNEELLPPAGQETRGFVYYTDTHLHFAFEMGEPALDKIRVNAAVKNPGQRDSAVWQDDDLEIFLSPANDGRHFYQFGFNAAAVIYDGRGERSGPAIKIDPTWNTGVRAAAGRAAKSWILEIAISLGGMLQGDPTGMGWSFNVQRQRTAGESDFFGTLSVWSSVDASTVREPQRHGQLLFGREPDIEVVRFAPVLPRFGRNAIPIRLRNRSEEPVTVACLAVFTPEKGDPVRVEQELVCPARGAAGADLPYTLDRTGNWSFEGVIRREARMVTWRQESFALPAELASFELSDSIAYAGETLTKAVLLLNVSSASLKDLRLELALRSGNETLRKEEIGKLRSNEAVLYLTTDKLPPGADYTVEARLLDAGGKPVGGGRRALLKIAGPFD